MGPSAFLRGKGQKSGPSVETPMAAMAPAGSHCALFVTAAPTGVRQHMFPYPEGTEAQTVLWDSLGTMLLRLARHCIRLGYQLCHTGSYCYLMLRYDVGTPMILICSHKMIDKGHKQWHFFGGSNCANIVISKMASTAEELLAPTSLSEHKFLLATKPRGK